MRPTLDCEAILNSSSPRPIRKGHEWNESHCIGLRLERCGEVFESLAEQGACETNTQVQSAVGFIEGMIGIIVTTFIGFSIICFRKNFKKQIRLYFNLILTCFFGSLYLTVSRMVYFLFHFFAHPADTFEVDEAALLVKFDTCYFLVYFWVFTRDIMFISTIPITVDRLMAILKPRSYKFLISRQYSIGVYLLTWCLPLLHVIIIIVTAEMKSVGIFLSQHSLRCVFQDHVFDGRVSLSIYLGVGVPTLLTHILAYTFMFLKLRSKKHLSKGSMHLLKVGVLVAGSFSVVWLPQLVTKIILHSQGDKTEEEHGRPPNWMEFICFITSNSTTIINSIIYIICVRNIRVTLISSYKNKFRTSKSSTPIEAVQKISGLCELAHCEVNKRFFVPQDETCNEVRMGHEVNKIVERDAETVNESNTESDEELEDNLDSEPLCEDQCSI